MLVNMDGTDKENWATGIRTFLSSRGLSHVWLCHKVRVTPADLDLICKQN